MASGPGQRSGAVDGGTAVLAGVEGTEAATRLAVHPAAREALERDVGAAGGSVAAEPYSEAEAELIRAVRAGEEADLKRRPIRAALLRELLLETRAGWSLPPAGLKLSRAIIQGTLDLDGCVVAKPILIRHSRFEATPGSPAIVIRDARLRRLGIHASTIDGAVMGDRADVENGLYLGGGTIRGAILLRGASIGGALGLEGAEAGDGKFALVAAGLRLRGPLIVRRTKAMGTIRVTRAHLAAGIYGDGVRIVAEGVALDAESARVGGDILLAGAELKGSLCLANARVEGRLAAEGLSIEAVPVALMARGLDVSHGISLDDARLRGTLDLEGAAVGRAFRAQGIEIDGGEIAIAADVMTLGGNWDMPRARLIGEVKIPGARIQGQLRLTEARVFGADVAIRGDGAELRGGCFMARATVLGLVRFPAASFGNQLRLRGASLKVEAGMALLVSAATFSRDVELSDGFQANGAVVLDQSRVAGALDLRGSNLSSAAIARNGLPAPSAVGQVPARLDELALSLSGADVNRLVMPLKAEERPRGVVDLSRARVSSFEDHADCWPLAAKDRARSRDGRDIDHMILDGFDYGHLTHPDGRPPEDVGTAPRKTSRSQVAERRITWLDGQEALTPGHYFRPQAWVQLSERLERQGYGEDALKIDVARRRRERSGAGITRAARWQSRLLDWLALYGHNPWRTIVWMAAVVVLFSGVWMSAAQLCGKPGCFDDSVFVVRNKDAYRDENFARVYPAFHALAYSFDVFVPFVSFGYEDHWRPNLDYGPIAEVPLPFPVSGERPWIGAPGKPPTIAITLGGILYVLGVVEAVLGIVLTSLLVTGFTGLLRRRRE